MTADFSYDLFYGSEHSTLKRRNLAQLATDRYKLFRTGCLKAGPGIEARLLYRD
jgi:hypothetical protein